MARLVSGNGWPASANQAEIGIGIFTVVPGIRPVRVRCAAKVAPLIVGALKEWEEGVARRLMYGQAVILKVTKMET
jgi:hypothetical protein